MSPWSQILCSESLIFSPTAHFLQYFPFKWHFNVFPISMLIRPTLTRHKIGQGHHRVIFHIYIVVLESSVFHVKFL